MAVPVVAIIDSDDDTVSLLRYLLECEGIETVAQTVEPSKYGLLDFIELLRKHDPKVVIFDISMPYQTHWALLRLVMDFEAKKGRQFLLTTTHMVKVAAFIGSEEVFQLIEKPYDFQALTRLVKDLLGHE